jgi:hypothetical protein
MLLYTTMRKEVICLILLSVMFGCTDPATSYIRDQAHSHKNIDVSALQKRSGNHSPSGSFCNAYMGHWIAERAFLSTNPGGINTFNRDMIDKNIITIYADYIVDTLDSCAYDTVITQIVSTDDYLDQYNYKRKDLGLMTDTIPILKFRKRNDPDNSQYYQLLLDKEFIVLDKELITNINGTFFLLKRRASVNN